MDQGDQECIGEGEELSDKAWGPGAVPEVGSLIAM